MLFHLVICVFNIFTITRCQALLKKYRKSRYAGNKNIRLHSVQEMNTMVELSNILKVITVLRQNSCIDFTRVSYERTQRMAIVPDVFSNLQRMPMF